MTRSESILEIARQSAASSTGKLGFAFLDLTTGESCSLNGGDLFPAASVFKIYVLAELFRQIGDGRFKLSDRFPLKPEYKSEGSGLLYLMDDGLQPTLRDYALLMMTISDNSAADFLFRLVGQEQIQRHVLDALSLKMTKCDLTCDELVTRCYGLEPGMTLEDLANLGPVSYYRSPYYLCTAERNDVTSPLDTLRLMEHYYRGTWCDRDACDTILGIMKECQTNSRIPRYLPKNTDVAHKTGSLDRIENDVGIVYTPRGNYIISLFYNGHLGTVEEYENANYRGYFGDELLARLSRSVYDCFIAE